MKQQRGMSLIEVMVSIAILASGLLGLAALQSRSIILNQSAYYRSIAADLAADLADRIRANRSPYFGMDGTNLLSGLRLPPNFAACVPNPDAAACGPDEVTGNNPRKAYLVKEDIREWNSALSTSSLPNASYTLEAVAINSDTGYRYKLTISWADGRANPDNPSTSYTTVIE